MTFIPQHPFLHRLMKNTLRQIRVKLHQAMKNRC